MSCVLVEELLDERLFVAFHRDRIDLRHLAGETLYFCDFKIHIDLFCDAKERINSDIYKFLTLFVCYSDGKKLGKVVGDAGKVQVPLYCQRNTEVGAQKDRGKCIETPR